MLYQGPLDHSIVYDHIINSGSWADANFSIDTDTSLSVSGNVSNINIESKRDKGITGGQTRIANGPINCCSKAKVVVAFSTQKSEFYVAAHMLFKKVWRRMRC